MTRAYLQFLRQGRVVRLDEFPPHSTILDYLRLQERATGTKEGCAEGDCGACTVVLARADKDRIVYEPVNSCIALLGQLDGAELIAIEDIADGPALHPIQAAMVAHHGSQCGFCTPGIVMSLFARFHQCGGATDRDTINDVLAGNLCRCTGYRPIVDAALEACNGPMHDRFTAEPGARLAALRALTDDADIFIGTETSFLAAPASEDEFARLYAKHSDATIVAGTSNTTGAVYGFIFDDRNGNAVRDGNEFGQPGWDVWADVNGNGVQDPSDPVCTTSPAGEYQFANLPAGLVTIHPVIQPAWYQTTPGQNGLVTINVLPKIMTRAKTERIARFAFDFAIKNGRKSVTCVHKANIMKLGDGLFLNTCRKIAEEYKDSGIAFNDMMSVVHCSLV